MTFVGTPNFDHRQRDRTGVLLTNLGPIEDSLIRRLERAGTAYAAICPDLDTALQMHDDGYQVVVGQLDDPAVRELMGRYLVREGFRIVVAGSGDEGLRLARERRPDAITLDVMMPGLDGWAVLGALKADAATADIPVVMLTIVDDRNLGYTLGAAEYLTKPVDRERLLAVLARYRRDRPVLIVEDDGPLRELLRRMLEREGYAVVEAEHGRAALDRVREAVPGAILLDLMMPVMDGFEFLAELRVGLPVSRLAKWKTTFQLVCLGALILGAAMPWWNVDVFGITANVPHTVGLTTLWAAAVLTVITGWDYLRVGLKHMD